MRMPTVTRVDYANQQKALERAGRRESRGARGGSATAGAQDLSATFMGRNRITYMTVWNPATETAATIISLCMGVIGRCIVGQPTNGMVDRTLV